MSSAEPSKEDLLCQYNRCVNEAQTQELNYDVIEFLCDGSFFNEDEYPHGFQTELFERIAKQEDVKRVLVESRPEYVDAEKVGSLRGILRSDQCLEIGVGFETADEFIRAACIQKGFSRGDFENMLRSLAVAPPKPILTSAEI